MIPKYVPILRAKKGEFDAYKESSAITKRHTVPFFDIFKTPEKNKRYQNAHQPTMLYFNDIAADINDAVEHRDIIIDISRWAPNSTIENGEHILGYIYDTLSRKGTHVIPTIGYERWEDEEYRTVLEGLSERTTDFCIRLESYAFEDMVEEDHFHDIINDIISSLNLDCTRCCVVLDLADITKESITNIQEKIERSVKSLKKYNFKYISIAGCSVTTVINSMVPSENSTGLVIRKEWMAWKIVRSDNPTISLIFGDYGMVNPQQTDGVIAPDANGKIRHTIKDKLFVLRGYSRRKGEKGAQMHSLCHELINSPHYISPSFSWGDEIITKCSDKKFKGNPTQWISIDTNHHMTFAVQEIIEFELNTLTQPVHA